MDLGPCSAAALLTWPSGAALVRAIALEAPHVPELRELTQQFWAVLAPLYMRTLVTRPERRSRRHYAIRSILAGRSPVLVVPCR